MHQNFSAPIHDRLQLNVKFRDILFISLEDNAYKDQKFSLLQFSVAQRIMNENFIIKRHKMQEM